ncbi:LacI family DNA-binding transcriptional regulator [Tunicatimonas pelagia]|uniref:LacI family DNA-binding transcriptional regulator n=1 Tax=Tunicatimonas pelagia TaxID=931531 RepID=UPI002666EE35|nr:LacI family DNA-binding transcriptional regulator [Tunicatimonas pelagia]WKN46258.1 LacI family DNA-binding transcriptional regulator [Tunicatimonas pelagia]
MKPITLKEIAEQLNISISTVSRALRDHPRISRTTKQAVQALAKELDFQPNPLAMNLRMQRTQTIGVIVPKISYAFYASAITGIEAVAIGEGYNIVICQSNESYEQEVANIKSLLLSRVDGIIVSLAGETKQYDHFQEVLNRGVPLVFFNRVCPELSVSQVIIDNFLAAAQAVSFLIQHGCQRIGLLAGPSSVEISNERLRGYQQTLAQHQLPFDPNLVAHCDYSEADGYDQTVRLLQLSNPPDAIFAVSDRLAIAALQALRDYGIRIPQDMALVGFNNDPVTAVVSPSLTTIDQNPEQMGETAAHLLFQQLRDAKTDIEQVVLKTRLLERNSVKK